MHNDPETGQCHTVMLQQEQAYDPAKLQD